MSRLIGLRYFVLATAILHMQACNAAVIRNLETTTISLETTPQVSTTAATTIPQDIIAQTTLPPILLRTTTLTDSPTDSTGTSAGTTSTDTAAGTTSTDTSAGITEPDNPTTPEVQPEPAGELLAGRQLQLGGQSTLDTSTVDSDTTLVPTTQLVPLRRTVPDVEQPALDTLVKTTTENADIPSKILQNGFVRVETMTVSKSVVKSVAKEAVSTSKKVSVAEPVSILKAQDTLPEPESIPRKADAVSTPLWTDTSDSFIPPAMHIMAYVIDALWEREHKNLDDGYKVTEDVNDTKDDWEDDDMSKPRFQTNVPIVNSESVPMRMHMDIVPQGFPEDLEGSILYPDYYDDKDTKNELEKYGDLEDRSGDAEDDVEALMERFAARQQQMRFFRFSDTFDKLVELHRDLALYAKVHDIDMQKGFSERVTDVLRKSTGTEASSTGSAASQLQTVIAMISQSDEVDDESLDTNLRHFRRNLAQSNSEPYLALSSLPALHFS